MRQCVIDKLVIFWGIYIYIYISSVIKVSVMDILKCLIIKGLLSDREVSKNNHNYYYYVFYFMLVYG